MAGNQLWHLLILSSAVYLAGCGGSTGVGNAQISLDCPPPAVAQIEPWGKSGSQQICKIKHGPFIASEDGYIHLRGSYQSGEKSGVWRWYDRTGVVVKEIDYGNTINNDRN